MGITSPQYQAYLAQLNNLLEQKAMVLKNKDLPTRADSFKTLIEDNKETFSHFAGIEGEIILALKSGSSIESVESLVVQKLPLLKDLEKRIQKIKKVRLVFKKDKKNLLSLVKEISVYLKLTNAIEYRERLNKLMKEINKKQQRILSLTIKFIVLIVVGAIAVIFISAYWHIILSVLVVVTIFWIWRTLKSTKTEDNLD